MAVIKLFGNSISPNCDYCMQNKTPDDVPTCSIPTNVNGKDAPPFLRKVDENGNCPFFSYNPLFRKPKVLPPLRQYHPEDFEL